MLHIAWDDQAITSNSCSINIRLLGKKHKLVTSKAKESYMRVSLDICFLSLIHKHWKVMPLQAVEMENDSEGTACSRVWQQSTSWMAVNYKYALVLCILYVYIRIHTQKSLCPYMNVPNGCSVKFKTKMKILLKATSKWVLTQALVSP